MANSSNNINTITDHLFRHESGKMASVLTKIFGAENLETVEDVVQQTFIDAMQVWKLKGLPDNPSAWLFRVAKNKTIDVIRRNKHSTQYDFNDPERVFLTSEYTLASTLDDMWQEDTIQDDMLRMMFTCCHPDITPENQITLILKILCGFSTAEIARALLTPEDTVSKRLYRTKNYFRKQKSSLKYPSLNELKNRKGAVLKSIYLLFNEGYNSTQADDIIREDLISEAMMLCKLITDNEMMQSAEANALMALMCFHSARSASRISSSGEIILLDKQDRSKWNFNLITEGNEYMNKAAYGDTVSTYHIEAAIAFEHCVAGDFEKTNWARLLELYDWLVKISPSEIATINRAVIVLKLKGASSALLALKNIKNVKNYYLYYSLLGEIYAEQKDMIKAKIHFEKAMALTHSNQEKRLLNEKIQLLFD